MITVQAVDRVDFVHTNKTCVIRASVRRSDSCRRHRQEDPSPISIHPSILWNEDYVESQSDLICRAQSVAKDSLLKAADADKQRWDRRALAGPIPVGHRVLLKQCAFTGRHKLSNHYGDTSYVVVRSKTDRNL